MKFKDFLELRITLGKTFDKLTFNEKISNVYLKELIKQYTLIDNESFFYNHNRDSLGFYQKRVPNKTCYVLVQQVNEFIFQINESTIKVNNFEDLLIQIAKYVLKNAQ